MPNELVVQDIIKRVAQLERLLERLGVPEVSSGGSGAPVDASYVVISANATLTAERVIGGESGVVTITDGGSTATVGVAADGISNSKLANMGGNTLKGNNTGSAADPADLTQAQATAMLNSLVGDSGSGGTKGLVPAPAAGDASKFLKGDATWGTPAENPFAPASALEFIDDFLYYTFPGGSIWNGDSVWAFAGSLGWNAVAGEANHPGVMELQISTINTAEAIHKRLDQFAGGNGELIFEIALKLTTLSSSSERYIVTVGFGDVTASGDQVDGAYFRYSDNLQSGNWERCTANNSTRTQQSTGVAVTTSWTRLRVVMNSAGTQVDFYIDGTSAGSITTNIPTGAGREFGVLFKLEKTVGNTARQMRVDYVYVRANISR